MFFFWSSLLFSLLFPSPVLNCTSKIANERYYHECSNYLHCWPETPQLTQRASYYRKNKHCKPIYKAVHARNQIHHPRLMMTIYFGSAFDCLSHWEAHYYTSTSSHQEKPDSNKMRRIREVKQFWGTHHQRSNKLDTVRHKEKHSLVFLLRNQHRESTGSNLTEEENTEEESNLRGSETKVLS